MKIVITGSAGFVGSNLVKQLSKNNSYELQLLDLQNGYDICNWEQIKEIKADLFIHLANKSFVLDSYKNPLDFYTVNVNSTLHILELARINKAKVIYLSSYIYGTPRYLPINEEHPIDAFNPYAQTKVICEEMCVGYSRDFQVPITIFRPFNIYGKGQNEDFLIPTIIKQAKLGAIEINDDRPKRDFIHIDDIVSAIEKSISFSAKNLLERYNLGTGVSYSVKEIVDIVVENLPNTVTYSCKNQYRPNEVMDTVADISKAKELGWKPMVQLVDGLKAMLL